MKCLVTGGTGFVGKALCLALRQRGYEVIALARGRSEELLASGVSCFQFDLGLGFSSATRVELASALRDVECIFHVAAKVGMWGSFDDFYATNVKATRELLSAAKKSGVRAFIYTSSPSVIASGKDLKGVGEATPYPSHYDAYYPMTKAMAERSVIEANSTPGSLGIRTLALRPHLIWGPGDTNLLPTIIGRARQGRLVKIGSGENLVDFSYIDDCVNAHLCAMEALLSTDQNVKDAAAGRAYFISQGEPTSLWGFIDEVLRRSGVRPISRRLSHGTAGLIARVLECVSGFSPKSEPLLTKFLVDEMATDHYFDISAAARLLGYLRSISMAEGLERTFSTESHALSCWLHS
jgi:2-alkyl-3-oxoalkanoate reductase